MRTDLMKIAKVKAANFCVYQERTQQEVRDKLYALGLFRDEVEQTLSELISENFVNEERFAIAFANGRFKLKHWGKTKIGYELKKRKISRYCIDKALRGISESDYENAISDLIEKKSKGIPVTSPFARQKIAGYLIAKGFESDLVWKQIETLLGQS
jgi:regulatory protein